MAIPTLPYTFEAAVLDGEGLLRVAQLRVQIDLTDRNDGDLGHVVRVVLRDTSDADALHPTVAETTGIVQEGSDNELTLDVPDGALSDRRRYSLWAHVDHVGDGNIHSGDLITTQDIRVVASDTFAGAAPIRAPLKRV